MRITTAVLVLLAVPFSPLAAHAQVEAGVLGGVSFGNISNSGVLPGDLSTRTGFAGGGYIGYRFGDVVGVEGNVLYAQRGETSDASFATAETKLDYIDVPVLLTANIPLASIRPYAYAGPQVSFEVACHTAAGATCDNADREKTDYAAVIGAGVRFGAPVGLGLEARYVYGLKDLSFSTVSSSESYQNRTFMILARIGR
jgi:hypothetical protein